MSTSITATLRTAPLLLPLAVSSACAASSDVDASTHMGASSSATDTAMTSTSSLDGAGATSAATSESGSSDECAGLERWPGDLVLADALDDPTLACVREVEGVLEIGAISGLLDLDALASVERVGGLEVVGNPELTTLHGLEALRSAGWITVTENPVLVDLRALAGVETIGSWYVGGGQPLLSDVSAFVGDLDVSVQPQTIADFQIYDLPAVATLAGLATIGTVTPSGDGRYRVLIGAMPALTDTSGLAAFAPLQDRLALILLDLTLPEFAFAGQGRLGSLELSGNPSLHRLELDGIDSVGRLTLGAALPSLLTLDGLEQVEHFDTLDIGDCGAAPGLGLSSLAGLDGVTSIDALVIVGAPALTSIDALPAGTALGSVLIRDNPALDESAVLARLALLDVRGDVTVCGNANAGPCPNDAATCTLQPIDG